MSELITFDDVLIKPRLSTIKSRSEVNLSTQLGPLKLSLPILSANMDTITGTEMAIAMWIRGGLGVLHRFQGIVENITQLTEARRQGAEPAVSIGLGKEELERAENLYRNGARVIVIDVAHAAQIQVVEQFVAVKEKCPEAYLVVGNFATGESIMEFIGECGYAFVKDFNKDAAVKVGIGPGSACTTRIKTGVGIPQLSAIVDCAKTGVTIIADGGMKTPGDIAKALAAGARAVMLGGMLAGTEETPGEIETIVTKHGNFGEPVESKQVKKYRGSASKESYELQGKRSSWRTAEGESFTVLCKGRVGAVLSDIEGGLRSAFTYVGARNLQEFQQKAILMRVSTNSVKESGAHGKT